MSDWLPFLQAWGRGSTQRAFLSVLVFFFEKGLGFFSVVVFGFFLFKLGGGW